MAIRFKIIYQVLFYSTSFSPLGRIIISPKIYSDCEITYSILYKITVFMMWLAMSKCSFLNLCTNAKAILHLICAAKYLLSAQQQKHSNSKRFGQIKIITYELIKFNVDYVNIIKVILRN